MGFSVMSQLPKDKSKETAKSKDEKELLFTNKDRQKRHGTKYSFMDEIIYIHKCVKCQKQYSSAYKKCVYCKWPRDKPYNPKHFDKCEVM